MAPVAMDLDALNLSQLAERSVSAEVIQPGDLLEVTMVTDFTKLTTTTAPVRVAGDGGIVVPLVGRLTVAGLEVEQAERLLNIESISRGIFRTPCMTLSMKQCHTSKVTVVGAVKHPGTHALPRGSTSLMSALLAAGGVSKEAGTEVEIRRLDSRQTAPPAVPDGGVQGTAYEQPWPAEAPPAVFRVDLAAAANGLMQPPDLCDGDVVRVAKRNIPPVQVIGLVNKPGQFPYPADQKLYLLDALALAGGCSNALAENVLVIRQPPEGGEPVRIALGIQAAKNGSDNLLLAPGDTVSVEQTAATAALGVVQTIIRFSVGGTLSWF
jgi:polysaccharide export outer membrane protein